MADVHWRPRAFLLAAALVMAGLSSGCAGETGANLRAWIDVPADGAVITAGENVEVHSHAYAKAGVAEVMLSVNGEPVRRDPADSPGAAFAAAIQPWMPEGPGDYKLEVIAYDLGGAASAPAVARVRVLAVPTSTPTPTATLTPLPSVTPTLTPIPLAGVTFSADDTSLTSGECTRLRWEVVSATAVSLDGVSVALLGSQQACPTMTTTYRLHVTAPSGDIDKTVTVTISAPADTTGPSVTGVSNNPEFIWDATSCGPAAATITAQVSDASGLSEVVLHYRALKSPKGGVWRALGMNAAGGGTYQATLGPSELTASLALYGGGSVEFYIVAVDANGNSSQSGTRSFEAKLCFG
jgi:hypothetical protein